ncbi:MAG: hypothetical protein PVS3B3_21160 [Ktedonobacteraceae bacterium]
MIEMAELHSTKREGNVHPVQQSCNEAETHEYKQTPGSGKFYWLKQMLQFGLVGGLNTLLDLLILNGLLLLFPTTSTTALLTYNVLAFSLGAINSFLLNKYWTFGHKRGTTLKELLRFMIATLCGIGWSTLVLWLASTVLHPLVVNATLWANLSKGMSVASSALLSYLGMRLWVFVRPTTHK